MKHETKQVYYNRIKGRIAEINNTKDFPSVTLKVGHAKTRHINVLFKPAQIENLNLNYNVNDDICLSFFVSSRFKHGRWYTMCNCIEIVETENAPQKRAPSM